MAIAQLDNNIEFWQMVVDNESDEVKREEAMGMLNEAMSMKEDHVPSDEPMMVTIGFLPARKKRELTNAYGAILSGKSMSDRLTEDELTRGDDIRREWLKWGIRNHSNFGVEFERETIEYRGTRHEVASEGMLEIYEHMGVLRAVCDKIINFNSIHAKKKTRSSSTSGESKETSTAQPVPETQR